jgi:inosine-uridine nucleoside N-ribohydrolase
MRDFAVFFIAAALLVSGCGTGTSGRPDSPVSIIFDTDLGPDYDDVGALAILHAMADSGKVRILATLASNKNELVGPSINVINTYFNRPNIPIGAPKGPGVSLGCSQHWSDSIVARYLHKLRSTSDAPDAVKIYRQILSSQPDHSVTIVTVGFLTNLSDLLKSKADNFSELDGLQLVGKKVRRLVSMAGSFPEGREFNVYNDSIASQNVFGKWPGEVIFTGFEIGERIFTGLRLIASPLKNSPVKDVFRISIPLSAEDINGRKSWDETAVIIAVYGPEPFFNLVRGKIVVMENGSNQWENDINGSQFYVTWKMPVEELTRFIEDRMIHVPGGK